MSNKSKPNRPTKHEKSQCEAVLKSGQRCKAWALRGGVLCSLHDPRNAAKVKEGRKRGGRMPRAKVLTKELKEIRTFEDLLAFLNTLIQDTYTGKISSKQSQAITSALSGIKSTIEAMVPPGGGRKFPVKMYDFDYRRYPRSEEEEKATRKILMSDKGREALRTLSEIVDSEEVGDDPRIPLPRPEKSATSEETPKFPLARAQDVPGAAIEVKPEQGAGEKAPEEEKIKKKPPKVPEEPPEEEAKEEERPTVRFVDSEAFWEMLEQRQRK